jgi:3-hydroxyisobutyrate dehydrogenase
VTNQDSPTPDIELDESSPTDLPRVAVIGTGTMGGAMAANLVRAGLRTTVWDRSPGRLDPLVALGAVSAETSAEAAGASDVIITMLATGDAVVDTAESGGLVEAIPPGGVWVQMGTIGIAVTDHLADVVRSRRPDVLFVDAPVSGTKAPAEDGQLLILASGPAEARARLEAVFSVLGKRTIWLEGAGRGSRLKLVLNTWLAFLIEGIAESAVLADHLDLSMEELSDALEGGPLGAPAALAKLRKIRDKDFSPEFKLRWALKDVKLALEAVEDGDLPVTAAIDRQWEAAVDRELGDLDLSAAWLAVTPAG